MAKYVNVEHLKVVMEQLEASTVNAGDDSYTNGVMFGVDMIEDVIFEHAVDGRLKWND